MAKNRSSSKSTKVSLRLKSKMEIIDHPPLASSWRIAQKALQTLWQNKIIFSLILLVYFLLDLVLVHSLSNLNVGALTKLSHGSGASGSFSVFSNMVSAAAGNSNASSGAYQLILLVIVSLAIIWTLRRVTAPKGEAPNLRSAFYQSMYPLVPFILLILLMAVQLLPFVVGSTIYSFTVGGGIAVNLFEQIIFLVILLAGLALSIFWLTRTVVALYIVTLPDTTPLAAYRSARELVRGRRLSIARKLIFLPAACFVVAAIIIVPSIMLWAPLAQILFYIMSLLVLFVVHAYFYTMYRDLLNEA